MDTTWFTKSQKCCAAHTLHTLMTFITSVQQHLCMLMYMRLTHYAMFQLEKHVWCLHAHETKRKNYPSCAFLTILSRNKKKRPCITITLTLLWLIALLFHCEAGPVVLCTHTQLYGPSYNFKLQGHLQSLQTHHDHEQLDLKYIFVLFMFFSYFAKLWMEGQNYLGWPPFFGTLYKLAFLSLFQGLG